MVPAGLLEAAAAVGMTKTSVFLWVHAPLALRSILAINLDADEVQGNRRAQKED